MAEQWQELAAARMTRFLARPAKNAKTRAYLATLPKRNKIVVKPEDYPLLITRADARNDYVMQQMRDAQRYADWERRGKPPSPSTPPRKDRLRPRAKRGRNPWRDRLFAAQDGLCGLCGGSLPDAYAGTIEHVMPRALGGRNAGNILLAHAECNNIKGCRPPTRDELATLARANDRLASLACSSVAEPSAHNGFDVGSIPAGPTSDSGSHSSEPRR